MKTLFRMNNTIQEYAWGSLTAIPELIEVAERRLCVRERPSRIHSVSFLIRLAYPFSETPWESVVDKKRMQYRIADNK